MTARTGAAGGEKGGAGEREGTRGVGIGWGRSLWRWVVWNCGEPEKTLSQGGFSGSNLCRRATRG